LKTTFIENLQVALLKVMGQLLAALPVCAVEWISKTLGDAIYYSPTRLRRTLFSNLKHAFPDRPVQWQKKIARENCRRTIELGLFVLASPYWSQKRLQASFKIEPFYREAMEQGGPYVILVPHFSGMEAITLTGLILGRDIPKTGVIYRPFNSRSLERYIKDTRQRGGVTLLSRKEGFTQAMEMLRAGQNVAILFDQNAGRQGALTLFMDRVASTTELPGLLVQRFKCKVGFLYTQRTGFWKAKMCAQRLDCEPKAHDVTLRANQWLEQQLKNDDNLCADWLWLHRRWKTQFEPNACLKLQSSRNILEETLAFQGQLTMPRRFKLWIRMPNWLGDIMMVLPFIRSIRASHLDAQITLLVKARFVDFLEHLGIADDVRALPEAGWGYFQQFWSWRKDYPERYLIFTHSLRSDLECMVLNPTYSHAIAWPGKKRYGVDHVWSVDQTLSINTTHQTKIWENWLLSLGLAQGVDLQPFNAEKKPQGAMGLIIGSENSPQKRWPLHHWRELIGHLLIAFPKHQFFLFGTQQDDAAARTIVQGFPQNRVHHLAGKTNLVDFAQKLKSCDCVIGNDTGGVHLSNALGIPTVVLFGPTNPLRTKPIFNSPLICLQPPGCPPIGGVPMDHLLPLAVLQEIKYLYQSVI